MSTFMFNSFAGIDNLFKTASGTGNFSPNFLNKKPEKSQPATSLLSKGHQFAIKLIISGLYLCLTILRRFVPSSVLNFFTFFIPPVLAFYELALRVYFPRLPSLFAIAIKLCQRGILTIDTIIWLASSLPTNFLGGLGALGGVAIQTTAAVAGVAASSGNALVGTTAGIVVNASKTVAQGIDHLKPAVVAADIAHVLSDGSRIVADHATSITSLVKNGETAVIENIPHLISSEHTISHGHLVPNIAKNVVHSVLDSSNPLLHIMPSGHQDIRAKEGISQVVSGDHAISPGHLVPDIAKNAAHTAVDNTCAVTDTAIGATKAAVTEDAAKLAHFLDNVNPLHLHIMPTGSEPKDAQAQANSENEPLIPHNINGHFQTVIGTSHAVADAGTRSATKPLGMVGNRDHSMGGLLHSMLRGSS